MPAYHATISIAAPREAVWRVLAAVVTWPEWLPTVSNVQPLDGNPLKIGSRYTVRQPKLRPATWVVTELEPPGCFVWQARSPGLLMIAAHTIEEEAAGRSRVALRFTFAGMLGAPLGWLFGPTTKRYLAREAAALKLVVEAQQPFATTTATTAR